MQGPRRWRPPTGTLGRLIDRGFDRAAQLAPRADALWRLSDGTPLPPSFEAALRRTDVAVIAEVKRASPSKGAINMGLRAGVHAAAYAAGGAAALSILTEPERFGGSLDDLADARLHVTVPLLRKDFIVDPLQIVEAHVAGASAVLLIVRALAPARLRDLHDAAHDLSLAAIVEIRDERELDQALDLGAGIIGVNNRNLETLAVDPTTAARVIPRIPADVVAVAESGVQGRTDVESAAAAGADAVLVGSSLSAAPDPTAAVRALVGVPRVERNRGR
ncbi:MAG TPA: indole-3-glycerol phosphate synthase TrpC [Gemmatimonadaceae bacterium]|nr:indole-3-glycerol phosphate synthase TrpC [Gemmatimonadaceae bacterium]